MGLDVFLYRYEDFEDTRKREAEYESLSDAVWKKIGGEKEYKDLTEQEIEEARAACKEIARSLNLEDGGSDSNRTRSIEMPSSVNPEHLFKVGYFRSSYNESGINRVLDDLIGQKNALDYIFNNEERVYYSQPDWEQSRNRALEVLQRLREAKESGKTDYEVICVRPNLFGTRHDEMPTDSRTALTAFLAEFEKQKEMVSSFYAYSNLLGDFFIKPMTILAAMPGTEELFCREKVTYLIVESPNRAEWYEQALEIVIETIDWVTAQPDREKYYLAWSA